MKTFNNISKGGLLGALPGGLAASRMNKPQDDKGKQIMRVGLFGIVGYLLGAFVEKKVKNKN